MHNQFSRGGEMKAAIIKIGNSQGLRIPKPIIKQCGFNQEVELEVHDKKLIIKPDVIGLIKAFPVYVITIVVFNQKLLTK